MKIYTKTGDKGETGLMGGKRMEKNNIRIRAYGNIDELNALLGLCRCHNQNTFVEKILHQLQWDLFHLGADLATPLAEKYEIPRVSENQIHQLEFWIDEMENQLEPLKNFILPGGNLLSAHLHVARTVCRRAERVIVGLQKKEDIGMNVLKYVNRLSDLLFVMARFANKIEGINEEKWQKRLT